jgi:predicted ATPase
VLLTSRMPLRVMAERRIPVQPLVTPGRSGVTMESLMHYGSVQLFMDRAQAVQPDFQLDATNAGAVAEICRRLDGLPLAIELAAARVQVLPPRALLDRLDRRLAILTRGTRDVPPRQQTLRATIDWSYDLLDEHERVLFRRIASFSGGCTLDAVEAVCNPDGTLATLDGMARLLEHSLLQREAVSNAQPASGPRFALLETIREYALERLADSGEEEQMRRNHALCYLALAEAAEPELYGPAHSAWITRLEREHDNLRVALAWSWQQGEHEIALRLAGALWRFWHVRGYLTEGRGWFHRLLTAGGAGSVGARIKALLGAGWLAHYQYDFAQATTLFEAGIALRRAQGQEGNLTEVLVTHAVEARNAGDYRRATSLLEECVNRLRAQRDRGAISRGGLGIALARLAMVHCERGDYAQAMALWEECLTLHRELADRGGVAISLLGLSDVAREQGEPARVRALCEECLAGFRDLGEQWAIGFALNNLALAAYQDGDLASAGALAEQSVDVFRGLQTNASIAEVLTTLGVVAGAQGDAARAEAALLEALGLAEAGAPCWVVAAGLEALAVPAMRQGVPARAVRLLGAAAALRAAMGVPLPAAHRGDHDRVVAGARTALGEAAYASTWQAGQALSFRQAVEEAVHPPLL